MTYPTMIEVREATHLQLARWYRHLPSTGLDQTGRPGFHATLERGTKIMQDIFSHFKEKGGMTPAISKAIGWGRG